MVLIRGYYGDRVGPFVLAEYLLTSGELAVGAHVRALHPLKIFASALFPTDLAQPRTLPIFPAAKRYRGCRARGASCVVALALCFSLDLPA